jgi:hypothetical protein
MLGASESKWSGCGVIVLVFEEARGDGWARRFALVGPIRQLRVQLSLSFVWVSLLFFPSEMERAP